MTRGAHHPLRWLSRALTRAPVCVQGPFLPGYRAVTRADPLESFTPPVGLTIIDHVVGNMPDLGMGPTVEWYERVLKVCGTFALPCVNDVGACGCGSDF